MQTLTVLLCAWQTIILCEMVFLTITEKYVKQEKKGRKKN